MKRMFLAFTLLLAAACASAPATRTRTAERAPHDVLADLPNDRADYWVEQFSQGAKRPEIEAAFARLPQYAPMIREKLRTLDMPEDLLYLAMAESGLNPEAHSAEDAAGIWQLVPDTARRYGLKVDETIDERHDPEKSTDAALAYLTRLYERFGSWYLAAAAYNAGENRVGRIMTEATGSEEGTDADYYRLWNQFPAETRDFVPAMIALMRIGHDAPRYGFVTQ